MRPVEKAVSSLISWIGGGVQPANRRNLNMFGPQAPIWMFLGKLGADENPEVARTAMRGLHLMEVFPALALASLEQNFFGRLKGPRYNPSRRNTFKIADWRAVIAAARK
jgi:predicted RNase H-like nuclease